MQEFDGKAMMMHKKWISPNRVWSTDSCIVGGGGWLENGMEAEYFHTEFPTKITTRHNVHINELECFTLVLALKLWGPRMSSFKVLAYCDNENSVLALNSDKAQNTFMRKCLREVVYLCAKYNMVLRVVHRRGVDNEIPDSLSRWSLGPEHRKKFNELTKGFKKTQREITHHMFSFSHKW